MILLGWLRARHGHVGWEMVCSGIGIPNLYDFLVDSGFATEAEPVASRITVAPERTRAIIEAGLGTVAGGRPCARRRCGCSPASSGPRPATWPSPCWPPAASTWPAHPPVVLPLLRSGPFLARLRDKGRLSRLVSSMPVSVALGPAALVGAASAGLRGDDPG